MVARGRVRPGKILLGKIAGRQLVTSGDPFFDGIGRQGLGKAVGDLDNRSKFRSEFWSKHLRLETPAPVSLGGAWNIHACFTTEAENVLQGQNAEAGDR